MQGSPQLSQCGFVRPGNSQYTVQIVQFGIERPHCIGPIGNNNSTSRRQIKHNGNIRISRMNVWRRMVVDKYRKPNAIKPQRTHLLFYLRPLPR
jgi:hypothetical protein